MANSDKSFNVVKNNGKSNPEDFQKEVESLLKQRFGPQISILTKNKFELNKSPFEKTQTKKEVKTPIEEKIDNILNFSKKPKEIKSYLDNYVIGQDDSKKTLSIAICNHYNQIKLYHGLTKKEQKNYEYTKQNVLMIGPTGVGKTYLIKQIAKLIDVPFVRADATKYSETGYIGANVEDLIKDLVQQADGDIQKAEYGIIYIDEVDKLAQSNSAHGTKDISGRGVQLGLLKMLEDCELDLRAANDPASQMQALLEMQSSGGKVAKKKVSTRHILFIVSGAFTYLEKIISKRLSAKTIGFNDPYARQKTQSSYDLIKQVTTTDLQKFGFEPEFIGRLPIRVCCHELSIDDLYKILKNSKGSIIKQFKQAFFAYGIECKFSVDALKEIARLAFKQKTGARSLVTIIDEILRDSLYELPGTEVKKIKVDAKFIENPKKAVEKLISESQSIFFDNIKQAFKNFSDDFYDNHNIKLKLNKKYYPNVISYKKEDFSIENIESFFKSKLKKFSDAIILYCNKTGKKTFDINDECLEYPEKYLKDKIKEAYSNAASAPKAAISRAARR